MRVWPASVCGQPVRLASRPVQRQADRPVRTALRQAARILPGAQFLKQGKRAKKQQTGERAEYFKQQQQMKAGVAEMAAADARHVVLMHGQRQLQALAYRTQELVEQEAEQRAEHRARQRQHLRRQEESLAAVPQQLYHMAGAALQLVERVADTAVETTEAAMRMSSAAKDLSSSAKQLAPPNLGLIYSHTLADREREVQEAAQATRAWAPVSAAFRPTLEDQKRGLMALGGEVHAARVQLAATSEADMAAKSEADREEGELSE